MKEMSGKMNDVDLTRALRHMAPETGSLPCLGCGYEHNCSLNGCAIIRLAVERLEELAPSPNDQLTLEELREMDGEPVWCMGKGGGGCWGIVHVYDDFSYGFECYTTEYGRIDGCSYGMDGMDGNDGWIAYRSKPEEGN